MKGREGVRSTRWLNHEMHETYENIGRYACSVPSKRFNHEGHEAHEGSDNSGGLGFVGFVPFVVKICLGFGCGGEGAGVFAGACAGLCNLSTFDFEGRTRSQSILRSVVPELRVLRALRGKI